LRMPRPKLFSQISGSFADYFNIPDHCVTCLCVLQKLRVINTL
jgi:hypothetical protein